MASISAAYSLIIFVMSLYYLAIGSFVCFYAFQSFIKDAIYYIWSIVPLLIDARLFEIWIESTLASLVTALLLKEPAAAMDSSSSGLVF